MENQTSKTQHPQTEQFVNTDATVSTREKRGEERLVRVKTEKIAFGEYILFLSSDQNKKCF